MPNKFKYFITGISKVLEISPSQGYVVPRRGDFRRDVGLLQNDGKRLAFCINNTLNMYGKQINNR